MFFGFGNIAVLQKNTFTPFQIGGMHSYYTASTCTNDGSTATVVQDISGKGETSLTVASGNPIYTAADANYNSLPSLSATTTVKRLSATFGGALAQPSTWYLVHDVVAGNANTVWYRSNAGNITGSHAFYVNTDRTSVMQSQDAGSAITSPAIPAGRHVTCCVYNGASSAIYVDDPATAFDTGSVTAATSATVFTIGNFATNVAYSWATAIQYSGAHDEATRTQIIDYLSEQYALNDYASVFDPATLSLSGWWRGSYSGSPWTPTASAGSSGSNGNLTEATNAPSTGGSVNSYTSADFNGSDDVLANAGAATTFFSTSAWSVAALIWIDTAPAYGSDEYDNESVFAATGASAATISMCVSASGVSVSHFTGVDWVGVTVACGTGAWHLAQAKYDGTNIKLRIDDGSWSSIAVDDVDATSLAAETIRFGVDWNGSLFFDGKILDVMFSQTAISDANFDGILEYVNDRYALSL